MQDTFDPYDVNNGYDCPWISRDDSKWVDPRRTKEKSSHPYSYSEFFLFGDRESIAEADDAMYSDRIFEYDREKANRCWKAHMKDCGFARATNKQIDAFLTDYMGKPVKCIALAEGCNGSTGYEYFIVWMKYLGEQKTKK